MPARATTQGPVHQRATRVVGTAGMMSTAGCLADSDQAGTAVTLDGVLPAHVPVPFSVSSTTLHTCTTNVLVPSGGITGSMVLHPMQAVIIPRHQSSDGLALQSTPIRSIPQTLG